MRNIKYKVFIKELGNIFEVNTMTFLDEWIRMSIKWNDTRNFLVDWENVVLLEFTWLYDNFWVELFEWDIIEKVEHSYDKWIRFIIKRWVEEIPDNEWYWSNQVSWFYLLSQDEDWPYSEKHMDNIEKSEIIWNIYLNTITNVK
jgi:hypothetical protein